MTRFAHLFVLLCFLTALLEPACGFSWGGHYSVVEICTSQGIESKIVQNDDNPDAPTPHNMAEKCPFCLQKSDIKALILATDNTHGAFTAQPYKVAALQTQLLKEALYTPHAARAPPSFFNFS